VNPLLGTDALLPHMCPTCGLMVSAAASDCASCGERLDGASPSRTRRTERVASSAAPRRRTSLRRTPATGVLARLDEVREELFSAFNERRA